MAAVAIGLGACHLFCGWNHAIYDHHGFRQAQTAISTYFLLEGGPWVAYETPVFGAPWSIPIEFPTFQLLTAGVVQLTGVHLEQAGRSVGVLFYVVAMFAVWALFGALEVGPACRLVPVALMAVSPLLLFWSRTLMIESTAAGLGALYLLFVARHLLMTSTRTNLVLGAVFGVLTALTKVTTFATFGLLAASLMVIELGGLRVPGQTGRVALLRRLGPAVLAFAGLPFAAGVAWVRYADHLRQLNPMANGFLTTAALQDWTFGTWEQKTAWSTWQKLLDSTVSLTVGHYGVLAVVLIAVLLLRHHRAMIALSLASYVMVFAIFTNLYFVHDYYGCGNAVALIIAVALVVVALVKAPRGRSQTIGVVLLIVLVAASFIRYRTHYFPLVRSNEDYFGTVLGEEIRRVTRADEVVLIYGNDWSAAIPYGARRRALMDPWNLPPDHPKKAAAIAATGRDRITAMVICGVRAQNLPFAQERVEYFGFHPEGRQVRQCTLYAKVFEQPSRGNGGR